MSRFNKRVGGSTVGLDNKNELPYLTANHEDAVAFSMDAETELYSIVCTSLMNSKFYQTADEEMLRLRTLVQECDPEFVAKLAVYAREQMYVRTMPLVLTVELAKVHSGDNLVSRTVNRVVSRADEITELLSCYAYLNGKDVTGMNALKGMSKQIQKGLGMAFNKFDEYAFGKYNRDSVVKMKDALFLVHPKPKCVEQQALFDKIVNGTLETPYTWETILSADDGRTKKEKWEELIESKKLGYMASMRNLRNMLDAQVSVDHVEQVCNYLTNEKAVLGAKQFPFRYLSAFRMLEDHVSPDVEMCLNALEEAAKIAIMNLPLLVGGRNVIACDVSGSMQNPISGRSIVQAYDIGLLLGQLLKLKMKSAIVGIFGDDWKVKRFASQTPLANTMRLHDIEGEVGYSTNGYKVLKYLIDKGVQADGVFFFSDNQMWNDMNVDGYGHSFMGHENHEEFFQYWNKYKKVAPKAKAYFFDLMGYGNTPLSILREDVYFVCGWSDKVFTMLDAVQKGQSAVAEIKKIVL